MRFAWMKSPVTMLNLHAPRAAASALVVLVALATSACNSGGQGSTTTTSAVLPKECAAFVSAYGQCLAKTSANADITAARVEQTRLSLLDEASREPSGEQLRTKCVSAHERLRSTCQ